MIDRIRAEYPQFTDNRETMSDWDRVRTLMDFVYRRTPWARKADGPTNRIGSAVVNLLRRGEISLADTFAFFESGGGGLLCGGTAHLGRAVAELFGFDAWYLGVGLRREMAGSKCFTHAMVLVRIVHEGEEMYSLHDPSTNVSYAEATTNAPLDYFRMLALLWQRNAGQIAMPCAWADGMDRGRPTMILWKDEIVGRSPTEFESSWLVDPGDYQVMKMADESWRISSHRTVEEFDRMGDRWFKKELAAAGWPEETVYLCALPFEVADGPNSRALFARLERKIERVQTKTREVTSADCVDTERAPLQP